MPNDPNDEHINQAIDSAVPLDDDGFSAEESRVEGVEGPNSFGYCVRKLNNEWAFTLLGRNSMIIRELPDAPVEKRITFISVAAFRDKMKNKPTDIQLPNGKISRKDFGQRWLSDRDRRDFDGVDFFPNPDGAGHRANLFNLWQGFSVVPDAKAGTYDIFRDHLLTNFCSGDEKLFKWVFGWFAQMVQEPREKQGTAIVVRGLKGTGKTTVGDVIGSLFEAHYFLVDEPRYVTGNFNNHLGACLLLQADEAVWAGDKVAEGKLKSLITGRTQMIESKGVDSFRMPSYVRLMMTSNEDWVVPAGKDERRYCVLDIQPNAKENHGYFRDMYAELDNGGREALLADLLAFDISDLNLRLAPRTNSLLEQKIRSFDPIETFMFHRLWDGFLSSKINGWPPDGEVMKHALFNQYLDESDRIGIKRRQGETTFGIALKKLFPGLKQDLKRTDRETGMRKRALGFPPLAQCREAFERALGQAVGWPDDDDPSVDEAGEDADF